MGFFSWDCKICGHPMLSPYPLEDQNGWMNDVVVLEKDGSVLNGEYDGYGRVNEHDMNFEQPECYHHACWELAGKPAEWSKESRNANDQGYFFEDGVHNHPKPSTLQEAQGLKNKGAARRHVILDD